jgi:hypothetical protein
LVFPKQEWVCHKRENKKTMGETENKKRMENLRIKKKTAFNRERLGKNKK